MTVSEQVSVAKKGRPLKRALKAELRSEDGLEATEQETVLAGVAAFLSNGPGKEMKREGEIELEEDLLWEAKAALRFDPDLDIPDPEEAESEDLYQELASELEHVIDPQGDDPRAYFDSLEVAGGTIDGRVERDPLSGEYDRIYANSDKVASGLKGADSLQGAAFAAAEESGYLPTGMVDGSEISYAIQSEEGDPDVIFVDEEDYDTVGKLLRKQGREVEKIGSLPDRVVEDIEDEEEVPVRVIPDHVISIREDRYLHSVRARYDDIEEIGLAYVVESGATAEEYGLEVREMYSSGLLVLEPAEDEGVQQEYDEFRENLTTRGEYSLNPEEETQA